MTFICLKPMAWQKVYLKLVRAWEFNGKSEPKPPVPLVLSGWHYSNDIEKKNRWEATLSWAKAYGHLSLIPTYFPPSDIYEVEHIAFYQIGPGGGPCFLPWVFDAAPKVTDKEVEASMAKLITLWDVRKEDRVYSATKPLKLTGNKRRRLICSHSNHVPPPWGDWNSLSALESKRREFTRFRMEINRELSPHHVDHIAFIPVPHKF